MARLPYPDRETLSPQTRELLDKLPPMNIFRMMAGGGGLLEAFVRLGNHLLNKSKLDPISARSRSSGSACCRTRTTRCSSTSASRAGSG